MSDDTITINDEVKVEEQGFSADGLTDGEVQMAKDHGLLKSEEDREDDKQSDEGDKVDGEHKEQSKSESEEDKQEQDKEEEVEHPTFDDIEKDENKLKQYNKNEQALYWRYKSDKKKRQKAEKAQQEANAKYELEVIKTSAATSKLKKIAEALGGEVTVEQIQQIIGDSFTEKDDNAPLTKADLQRYESEKEEKAKVSKEELQDRQDRANMAESIGRSKYDNFDELATMANEVVKSDNSGVYRKLLEDSFYNTDISEENVADQVVAIARLHPKFGKQKSEEKSEDEKVNRAIENSKKKVSSASVGGNGSRRTISYDDLTVEDAAKLTTEQWLKIPDRVRARLLGR